MHLMVDIKTLKIMIDIKTKETESQINVSP